MEVMMKTAGDMIARCNKLKKGWNTRHGKFKDWYNILTLKDELAQGGMESVVSNDPRAGFNLALHLLTSSLIAHRIDNEGLTPTQIAGSSDIEAFFSKRWDRINMEYRKRGRQSWIRELFALMLSTGWFSVYVEANKDNLIAEIWHPAEVFPSFGAYGLSEVAHIYRLTPAEANQKVKVMGWTTKQLFTSNVDLYNYFGYDNDGDIVNGVVLGKEYMKPVVKEPELDIIPVFTSPVGGLHDTGKLATGSDWQKNFGESIVATDEGMIVNYNKMLTYAQQLVRDTANPRWFEQSRSEAPILREADLFKRGAIFRGTPEENITPLSTPPIPIELRSIMFDYQNMMQRGLFPWTLYGNIQQQITGYAMSQVASAAMQVLIPYQEAGRGLLTDIDNFWLHQMRDRGVRPHKFAMPKDMPDDLEFNVTLNIDIPGYLVQRVTVARMVNPQFRLSTSTTMDKLFPEIKDPLREQGKARSDEALNSPVAITVDQIIAYRNNAKLFRDRGDDDSAELYEKAAKALEAQIDAMGAPQQPQTKGVTPPREVMPREEVTPTPETTGYI